LCSLHTDYEVWQLSSRKARVKAVFSSYTRRFAVTFEVVSLRTNTLCESVFPLLKTFLEVLFWNDLQYGRSMSLNVGNISPSKWFSVMGTAKCRTGPNLVNIVDSPISISFFFFCQPLPDNERVMSMGIVMMQDPSMRPMFRSSPSNSLTWTCEYFQITMLVHCSTYHSFFCRDESTRLCNTTTASLLLPYLLAQHKMRNHRHVVTRRNTSLLSYCSLATLCNIYAGIPGT
jgi:hypothetical protein